MNLYRNHFFEIIWFKLRTLELNFKIIMPFIVQPNFLIMNHDFIL